MCRTNFAHVRIALILVISMVPTLTGCSQMHTKLNVSDQNNVIRQLSLARLHERQGDTESARKIYETVLKSHSDQPIAHHRLGVLAAKAGKVENALTHLNAARESGDATAELLNDIGYAMYLQGDAAGAEKLLRESLTADSTYKPALNNLGIVLGSQGKDQQSLAVFQEAGSSAQALNNLAFVQSQRGDVDLARQNYLKALDFDPKLKPAAQALVEMQTHRKTLDRVARRANPAGRTISALHLVPQTQDRQFAAVPETVQPSVPTNAPLLSQGIATQKDNAHVVTSTRNSVHEFRKPARPDASSQTYPAVMQQTVTHTAAITHSPQPVHVSPNHSTVVAHPIPKNTPMSLQPVPVSNNPTRQQPLPPTHRTAPARLAPVPQKVIHKAVSQGWVTTRPGRVNQAGFER